MEHSKLAALSIGLAFACSGAPQDASSDSGSASDPLVTHDPALGERPVLTEAEIGAIRTESKVVQARPSRVVELGDWSRFTFLDPDLVNDTFTAAAGTVAIVSDRPPTSGATNQRKVALRINDGLDHVGAEVVPALADEAGLDELDLVTAKTLFESVGTCNTYRLELRNVSIELPFGSTSVDGDFETGRKVKSEFDLPAAEARAELKWSITNDSNHWTCFIDPVPAMNITAEFNVGDLEGELDATLETSGSAVAIDTLDAVSFSLDEFEWDTSSWILDTVVSLGFGLYDLFDFTCSGQADCLSEAVNEYALTDDNLVDSMTALVNDAIDAPLTISTGTSSDGLGLSFSVGLESVTSRTAENTLTSIWNVTLGSTAPVDSCAANLSARSFLLEGATGNASLTNDDLELELPFHLISKAAYYAGKQGAFCYDFNTRILNVSRAFSVTPNGSIGVSGAGAGDPANTLALSLPLRITPTSAGVTGSVSGTVTVKGSITVDDGSDLVFSTTSATVSGLSGSVEVGGASVSAAQLSSAINGAAAGIVSNLDDLELLNAVVNTGIGGLSVAVDDVSTNGSALVIGLDLR